MKEVLEKIWIPEVIEHGNEGSWSSTQFTRLVNSHKIKQIITSTPPPFAERVVQTIKDMIHQRLDGLDMDKEKWIDMLGPVLKKYNSTKHSTTGASPNEAVKPVPVTLTVTFSKPPHWLLPQVPCPQPRLDI